MDYENVCEDCKKLPTVEEMTKCTHITMRQSLLKDSRKRKNMSEGLAIDKGKNLRENFGITVTTNYSAFSPDVVEALFNPERVTVGYENVDFFLACIDPNGGGSNDTAITIGAKIQGKYSILWANYKNTNTDFIKFIIDELCNFHKKIRKSPKIPVIVALEANANYNGDYVDQNVQHNARNGVQGCKNVHFLKENSLHGVNLHQSRKRDMLIILQVLMEQGEMCFHKEFSTGNSHDTQDVKNEMKLQLFRWKPFDTKTSLKLNGKKMKDNTGKVKLHNDDLVLTLLMLAYWYRMLLSNQDFNQQLRDILRLSSQAIF